MLDFSDRIQPVPLSARFKQGDYLTWGGSITRTPDGQCHLYVSRWPREYGHQAWVTHSEVAYATADNPLGPYTFQGVALGKREGDYWDRDVIHNPTVIQWEGKFYLYYNGNFGNGEYWDHRNNQRVGVASASHPSGPWQRLDAPLLDVSPDSWDTLVTTNPSCTPLPDGRFMLMYKGVGDQKELPFGGPVLHGVAFAEAPMGPFIKHSEPLFAVDTANFPAEDPFVFVHRGKIYAILKDNDRFYSEEPRCLVLFESDDGIDWQPADPPVVTSRHILWEDGSTVEYSRLERPQLYLEYGEPAVLSVAVKPDRQASDSYNIHIPLSPPLS